MNIIVLDRDGVINEDSDQYIKSVDEFVAIEGSIQAIAKLSRAGFTVAVATNQSGLARGYFDSETLSDMHHYLCSMVEEAGGAIDGIFYCPHGPDDRCECRKPGTGLLQQIEKEFSHSLTDAYFIGDSLKDLDAGRAHGCIPILVRTGKGRATEGKLTDEGFDDVGVFDDLSSAVDSILGSIRHD